MKAPELATLVQWLDEAGISDFEMKEPGRFIRVVMQGRGRADPACGTGTGAVGPARATQQVAAPARGIFMATHPLRAKPLAEVGLHVTAGDILGLVKVDDVLYRPVLAAHKGRVSRRWAADGEQIEEGTLLFDITIGGD
jgi:acetyl-CoA carboxylase biotin carboxyl carrier protein